MRLRISNPKQRNRIRSIKILFSHQYLTILFLFFFSKIPYELNFQLKKKMELSTNTDDDMDKSKLNSTTTTTTTNHQHQDDNNDDQFTITPPISHSEHIILNERMAIVGNDNIDIIIDDDDVNGHDY